MSGVDDRAGPSQAAARRWLLVVPAALFVALSALLFVRLFSGDPSSIPSPLVGKPAPDLALPGLAGLKGERSEPIPGLNRGDLASGQVSVVNVWASWCTPCLAEHPILMRLKELGVARIIGINYKDRPEAARAFLVRNGNPFDAVGVDPSGQAGIEWGVYKVPETFIVDGTGRIVHKHIGAIDETSLTGSILPIIDKARSTAR